jgi:endonuclease YncB( thermonuclease family)
LTSSLIFPIVNPPDTTNHNGNAMRLKTSSVKGSLTLCLLAGLTTLLLTSLSLAGEPIRTVTVTVTKVSDGDTMQVTTPEQTKLRIRLYGMDTPETPKINQCTGHINKPGQPTLWTRVMEGTGSQNHGKAGQAGHHRY